MKVIFVKNVPKVGKIGEVKEQPDGYVRNFLLPKGFAVIATPQAIAKLEQKKSEIRVEKEVQTDLFKKNLASVKGLGVTIEAKTSKQGSLFKAIHAEDIADALKKQCHVTISEEYIKLKSPIKQNGTFDIPVEALGMKEIIVVNIVSSQ
jgi:large subunit ribosomal protein L9